LGRDDVRNLPVVRELSGAVAMQNIVGSSPIIRSQWENSLVGVAVEESPF